MKQLHSPEDDSIKLFEEQVKQGSLDPYPYDRLMIAYRKEKKYKDELRIIKKGIAAFSDQLKRQQKEMFKGVKNQSAIKSISTKLNKQLGLADKKGNTSYLPQPLDRWHKRKETVEKKLN